MTEKKNKKRKKKKQGIDWPISPYSIDATQHIQRVTDFKEFRLIRMT